ncbi:MAG: hypothetical protein U9Q67_03605, partial [Patescibacteria group bacterium]|nr:hypothetical protein [Patescibacteria group bacterium]
MKKSLIITILMLFVINGFGAGTATYSKFRKLKDTPDSYSGQSGKYVKVKATEDGVEFATSSGGGDDVSVNSVSVTDPDFVSTGNIGFVDTANTITANINTDAIDDTHIDWGTGANQVSAVDIPDHDGHSVKDTFEHLLNRGKSTAITVSETGGLGISWTTGELYDGNTNAFIDTDAGSGNLTNHSVNYLKWVSGTALTISTTKPSGDEVSVATFSVYDGIISGYRETSLINESVANARRGLRDLFPTRIISGMSVSEDTDVTNALDVKMDAGVLYKEAVERKTPVEILSRNTAMVRHFHTAGTWDSDTNAQIETTNYDNGTQKTAIPNNKYVKGLFIFMNGKIGFVYPTAYYNTIAQAQAGALPTMPTGLEPIPKLTAVVYEQGDADFTNAVWQDVRAGISEEGFSIVSDHGALAGLSDDDHTQYILADGTRAFTGFPVTPSSAPDADYEIVNKKYVDDNSGDVSKVGTPVNNQIGVWTGDGTLEGDADLTFDGTNLSVTGNIGVGVSSPEHILEVKASGYLARILIDTPDLVSYPGFEFRHNGDDYKRAFIRSDYVADGFQANLSFWISGGGAIAQAMIIDGAGDVGIGTTNPTAPLEVDGEAKLSDHSDMGSNDASLATKKYVDGGK